MYCVWFSYTLNKTEDDISNLNWFGDEGLTYRPMLPTDFLTKKENLIYDR